MTGQVLPLWSKEMPRPRKGELPVTTAAGAAAVYFPTCVSRVMGALPGEPDDVTLMGALLNVAERAGVKLYIPQDAVGVCCGVPFSSKGFDAAHHEAVNHAIESFWKWTGEGAIPVVVDTSPCSHGLLTARPHLTAENQARFDKLRIIDSIEFANDRPAAAADGDAQSTFGGAAPGVLGHQDGNDEQAGEALPRPVATR